jgi:hypothetical protein
MEPREFGDPRVRFWLLDGDEEEIKVTEPKLDYPIPQGSRLLIEVEEAPAVDVRFQFNGRSEQPYELHFQVREGVDYQELDGEAKLLTYGSQADKDLLEEHYARVLEYGNTRVTIGMTHGRARIYIETE